MRAWLVVHQRRQMITAALPSLSQPQHAQLLGGALRAWWWGVAGRVAALSLKSASTCNKQSWNAAPSYYYYYYYYYYFE